MRAEELNRKWENDNFQIKCELQSKGEAILELEHKKDSLEKELQDAKKAAEALKEERTKFEEMWKSKNEEADRLLKQLRQTEAAAESTRGENFFRVS